MNIVCTGGLFKSWYLIKSGFVKAFYTSKINNLGYKKLNLYTIKNDSTIGAVILAARLCNKFELLNNVNLNNYIENLDNILISWETVYKNKQRIVEKEENFKIYKKIIFPLL